jgi:C-terminal processing protease CtpA/Prc
MMGEKVAKAAALPLKGRRSVEVVLLNGKAVEFVVGVGDTASQLFRQVVSRQSLQETHVFGLAVRIDRDDVFLDMGRRLVKYAPSGWATGHAAFTVFFRVKFYVENVTQLAQPLSRHFYYLQLRKDLMEGKMFCHDEHALHLAALAMQAERGTGPSQGQLMREENYVPATIVEKLGRPEVGRLLSSIQPNMYALTCAEAELEFLKEAQKLPEYGMLFYRVAKTKHGGVGSVWLGFCVRGVVVFDVHKDIKTAVQHCAWRRIRNMSHSHRKLVIELKDNPELLVFYTSDYKRAHYLLELSKACHKFHLVWDKKTHNALASRSPTTGPGSSASWNTAPEAIVEYPSPSRPSSMLENIAYAPPPSPASETVRVILERGSSGSFGFGIAGSSQSEGVYVVKVTAGGVSEGQLLVGDKIRAINGAAVESYQHALALLRACGSQVTIDVRRKDPPVAKDMTLPLGETLSVEVCKEAGVLGVRIAGGSDKPYGRGLVRVKQVTADTAGSRSGALREGDIILKVDSRSLGGMTHRQAADAILRAGEHVRLLLHRPSDPHWWRTSPTHSLTGEWANSPHTSLSILTHPPSISPHSASLPLSAPTPSPPQRGGENAVTTEPPELVPLRAEGSLLHSSSEPHIVAALQEEELSVADSRSEPNILLEQAPEREAVGGGESLFEVTLRKGYHGFGFRLDRSKSDKEGCGVFILDIPDNPAKGCRSLKPGDEIIGVDGRSLLNLPHQMCLQALRAVVGVGSLSIRRAKPDCTPTVAAS